ncbi:MAG: hypothetical protein JRL30_13050 [Deltaproteobacteria bacterium]|nr:hypothetical protein [Deltaproteobacteria bacterium]
MTKGFLYRLAILVLIMILSGVAAVTGGVSTTYGGEPSSGTVLQLPDTDRKALAILGKGVVGRAVAAVPIAGASGLMPLRAGKWTYRVLAGDHAGEDQEDRVAQPRHHKMGKAWRRVVGRQFIEYFRVGTGGNMELVSEVDLEEDVITRYVPVFSVIYEGMRPGETRSVETDIGVYDLHDPTDEKYKGRLKVTHTYIGAYEVVVPAGKYRTVLIKSTYNGKVGPASVDDVGYVFYSPGTGIVAAVERSHVSAFLFYNKKTRTPKVLLRREGF